jgi:hypothetical protein
MKNATFRFLVAVIILILFSMIHLADDQKDNSIKLPIGFDELPIGVDQLPMGFYGDYYHEDLKIKVKEKIESSPKLGKVVKEYICEQIEPKKLEFKFKFDKKALPKGMYFSKDEGSISGTPILEKEDEIEFHFMVIETKESLKNNFTFLVH